ncbi:hypothetical protein BURPS1710b_1515 [Burkholderia pseudomallei 1710b]|uniref:Uncharacterized protein n=1 Tax=Burkholderia pseudomallei (strain 1710b) TaxID=320372 RepID=Q3JU34_BURP1|nr:hypothetical protein BURPS1710b_1515 [Burkholderia pseudomallei 1710b]
MCRVRKVAEAGRAPRPCAASARDGGEPRPDPCVEHEREDREPRGADEERDARIVEVAEHRDHERHERDRERGADGPERHLELQRGDLGRAEPAAHRDLRQQDHQPDPHGRERRARGDHQEHVLRHQIVEHDADEQRARHHEHRDPRHAARGHRGERARRLALQRHCVHHSARAEDVAVDRGDRGADHDEVQDLGRGAHAERREDLHERAAVRADARPRKDRHQHDHRQHVEEQDAHRHRVDRARDRALGLLRLAGAHADHFDAAVREDHDRQRRDEAAHAVRQEAAVRPQVRERRRAAAAEPHPGEEDRRAAADHRDDRADLDDRQPELQLAEHLHVAEVQPADDRDDREHPDPLRDVRKPEAHVDAERGDVGDRDDHHLERVGPAGDEARERAEVLGRVVAERARHGLAHRHFAERAHHHVDGRAADDVSEDDGGARQPDRGRRAVEEARADRRAEREKADVPRAQMALQVLHRVSE